MGICFSKKNEIKVKRKPNTVIDNKSIHNAAQLKENHKSENTNNKEIAQNHPPESKSINQNRSSPTSNRTSLIEQKNSKDDLKSILKEEKKESKNDKNSDILKVVRSINANDKEESVNINKATNELDLNKIGNNLPHKYQTIQNSNIDVDNTFDKLINSNLNISEIDNDNVIIKEVDVKPLYNLV